MKTKTVGIRVLKDRLSAYVRTIAEGGEDVVITDRGHPVARLVRVDAPSTSSRTPLRIRHAVKDLSELSWMKGRPGPGTPRVRATDISKALEFTRGDTELP